MYPPHACLRAALASLIAVACTTKVNPPPTDDSGAGDTAADTSDSGDTSDSSDPSDSGDTSDSGETADTSDTTGDTADTADSDHTGDTADSGDSGWSIHFVDYCHLQWPCTMSAAVGTPSPAVYGWVYTAGVTEGSGQGVGITLELGVGPDGSNPAYDSHWAWSGMAYNADKDGLTSGDLANDEYAGVSTIPKVEGSYDYCVRASADGGKTWTYCDGGGDDCPGNGSEDGYDAAYAGALTAYGGGARR